MQVQGDTPGTTEGHRRHALRTERTGNREPPRSGRRGSKRREGDRAAGLVEEAAVAGDATGPIARAVECGRERGIRDEDRHGERGAGHASPGVAVAAADAE